MSRMVVLLLVATVLAPAALAQAPPAELPENAPSQGLPDAPAWAQAAEAVGEGAAAVGGAAAGAAGAVADGVVGAAKAAAALAGRAVTLLGHGLVMLGQGLAALAGGLLAAVKALGRAAAFLGGLAVSAAVLLGGLLATAASAVASALAFLATSALALAGAALALLGQGAVAGADGVRAHPREAAAVAGGATLLGGLAWLAKRFGLLALLPLYTRLAPSQMLDNEHRAAVYEHVKAHPGAHPTAIAGALGLGWGTVVYHLARLEETRLVTVKQGTHRKCFFAVDGSLDAQERAAVAAMSTDKAKVIVQAVRQRPGIRQKDLADALGMSQALASWHVKRLVEGGVLVATREGRSNALRVAEHVPVMAPAAPPAAAVPA